MSAAPARPAKRPRITTTTNNVPSPAKPVPVPRPILRATPVKPRNDTLQQIFSDVYRSLLNIPSNPSMLCVCVLTLILIATHNTDFTSGFLASFIDSLEPNAAQSIRRNSERIFGLISFMPVLVSVDLPALVYITVGVSIFLAPAYNVYIYSFYSLMLYLFMSCRAKHTRWFIFGLSVLFLMYFQSTVRTWNQPTIVTAARNRTG